MGANVGEEATVQSWLARAVRGDLLAVQKLILIHHQRLRADAERRLSSALRAKIEPEDLLQLVYVDVIRNVREFQNRGRDSFFQWMVQILESRLVDVHRHYHAAVRDVRREIRMSRSQSGFQLLASQAALDSQTPSRIAAREETEALLLAALAGLSDDHRRGLELRYLNGLPLARVAELMKRSEPAVQMLLLRAIRRLRDALRNLSRLAAPN
jgi:RNA polymerase sigma-70 factor (ECF subfamily)